MESSVVKVIELVKNETIVPLLHTEIIEEYKEVLRRDYLKIDDSYSNKPLESINQIIREYRAERKKQI